jgi:hypothetical protein
VAHDGEISLVEATESSNYFFALEEETTAKGNKAWKIKRSTSAGHSKPSHSVPQAGGSQLFAFSPQEGNVLFPLSMLAQPDKVNTFDDVDNWGDLPDDDPKKGRVEAQIARLKVLWGEWEVEKADYDTSAGQINDPAPVILAIQTVTNNSDTPQSSEIDLAKSVAEMSSWDFTAGFSLTVGASFSVGVPFVADGKISTEATVSTEFTYGQTKTTTTTVGQKITVNTSPHSAVKVSGISKFSTINVPCTLHLRSKVNSTVTTHCNMVYKGLTYWDFAVQYSSA